jgi:hypothetical protein
MKFLKCQVGGKWVGPWSLALVSGDFPWSLGTNPMMVLVVPIVTDHQYDMVYRLRHRFPFGCCSDSGHGNVTCICMPKLNKTKIFHRPPGFTHPCVRPTTFENNNI